MKALTNTFKFLFSQLFGGMNEENFGRIMNLYNQHMDSISKINSNEPYTFLSENIKCLKEENQRQKIPSFKQNEILQKWLNERNNFDNCFKSFKLKYISIYMLINNITKIFYLYNCLF